MRVFVLSLAVVILLTQVAMRAQYPITALPVAPSAPRFGTIDAAASVQPNNFSQSNPGVAGHFRTGTRTRTIVEQFTEKLLEEEVKRLNEFQSSVAEMRKKHDSKEAKEKARAAVEKLVVEQLDRDIQSREKQLSEIEEQVKQLRDQLEQRKSSKPELLKLLMMMIESPSSGIGLPSEWLGAINGPPVAEVSGSPYGLAPGYLPLESSNIRQAK